MHLRPHQARLAALAPCRLGTMCPPCQSRPAPRRYSAHVSSKSARRFRKAAERQRLMRSPKRGVDQTAFFPCASATTEIASERRIKKQTLSVAQIKRGTLAREHSISRLPGRRECVTSPLAEAGSASAGHAGDAIPVFFGAETPATTRHMNCGNKSHMRDNMSAVSKVELRKQLLQI